MAFEFESIETIIKTDLDKRNLTLGDYGLYAITLDQLKDLGLSRSLLMGASCGIGIPYPVRDGSDREPTLGNVKLLGNPSVKYLAGPDSYDQIFTLGPRHSDTVLITEGEFKAMTIHKHLLSVGRSSKIIGLRGVDNWSGKSQDRLFLKSLYDELHGVKTVYTIYDYDGTDTNPSEKFTAKPKPPVRLAESKLAAGIKALGIEVRVCRIGMFNANERGAKFAIDDHILRGGTVTDVLSYSRKYSHMETWQETLCYALNSYGFFKGEVVKLETSESLPASKAEMQWTGPLTRLNDDEKPVKVIHLMTSDTRTVRINDWVYEPDEPYGFIGDGKFNLFKSFGEVMEGDITPWTSYVELCLRDKPAEIQFLHDWVAYLVQNPCKKNFTFITLAGKENGVGKSSIAESITKVFGRSGSLMDSSRLFDKFNSHLEGLCVVAVDELASSKAAHVDQMKNFVTSSQLQLEAKGVNVRHVPNMMNLILTTNATSGTLVNEHSRRDAIITMPIHGEDGAVKIRMAMEQLSTWLEKGGVKIMRWWYGQRDLSDYSPYARAPKFEGLDQAIMASKSDAQLLRDTIEEWITAVASVEEFVVISNAQLRVLCKVFTGEDHARNSGQVQRLLQDSKILVATNRLISVSKGVGMRCMVFSAKHKHADGVGRHDYETTASRIVKLDPNM